MKIENPAFDYEKSGQKYSSYRQSEPKIAEYINKALNRAKTVLNVGAGAGSYDEPTDRYILAVVPSHVMRQQRLDNNKIPQSMQKEMLFILMTIHLMLRWL